MMMMILKRTSFLPSLLCVFLAIHTTVHGQVVTKPGYILGSEIQVGGFWPALSTEIRLDSADGETGTVVKFEDDLGFADRKALPHFQASWRVSKSWQIQADYVNLNRRSSVVVETEIEWPPGEGGEVFPIGAAVDSFLDFESARVAAAYVFRTSKNSELAVALGFHLTSMATGIALTVTIGDEVGAVETDAKLPVIPLPSLGLYWGIRLGEKWTVRLRGDFFTLSYDDYSGSLISARAEGAYQFSTHWAAGAGLNYYDLSLKAKKEKFTGQANFSYWGPSLFVRYLF